MIGKPERMVEEVCVCVRLRDPTLEGEFYDFSDVVAIPSFSVACPKA